MKIINLKKKIEPHVCAPRLACVCIYNEILFAQSYLSLSLSLIGYAVTGNSVVANFSMKDLHCQ